MVSGNFINLIGNELLSTGSELFSYLTCLRATTFLMFSVLSIVKTIILEIWETTVLPHEMFSSGFRLWLKLKRRLLKFSIKLFDGNVIDPTAVDH